MYMDVSIAYCPWYIWVALYMTLWQCIQTTLAIYNAAQIYQGKHAIETSMYILGGTAELTRTLKMTRMMRLNWKTLRMNDSL